MHRFLAPLLLPLALALVVALLLFTPEWDPELPRSASQEPVHQRPSTSEGPRLSAHPRGRPLGPREDAQPAATSTCHLLITRRNDASPIRGARVTVVRTDAPLEPLGPVTVSDAAGRVTIVTTTASDGLTVVVRADGFAARKAYASWNDDPSRPTRIRMGAKQGLRGRVVDAMTSTPIAGARIHVRDGPFALMSRDVSFPAGFERGIAHTDADGAYRLEDVRPSSTLHISAKGYASTWVRIQGLPEARRDGGVVFLVPASSLCGQLVGAQGEPLEGATLHLVPAGFRYSMRHASVEQLCMAESLRARLISFGRSLQISQEPGLEELYVRHSAVTDARGHFEFIGLPYRAAYDLSTVSEGATVALAAGVQCGQDPRWKVRLPAPEPTTAGRTADRSNPGETAQEHSRGKHRQERVRSQREPELRLRIPISVPSGVEPPKTVSARLHALGSSRVVEQSWGAIQRAGGTYVVAARPSDVTVELSAPGFLPAERRVDSGARTAGALPHVLLDPGGTLTVRVIDAHGAAVEGAEVAIVVAAKDLFCRPPDTNAAGMTTTAGLPRGSTVAVSALSQEHGAAQATWNLQGRNHTRTLQLISFGVVWGQILDLQGAPLDRVQVSAERLGPGNGHEWIATVLTGRAGIFRLRLEPGRYRLSCSQPGERKSGAVEEVNVRPASMEELRIHLPRR